MATDSAFWRDLEARFRELLQIPDATSLKATCADGLWTVYGWPSDKMESARLRERFLSLANAGAIAAGLRNERNPLDGWLNLLRRETPYFHSPRITEIEGDVRIEHHVTGAQNLVFVSAEYCKLREVRAFESETAATVAGESIIAKVPKEAFIRMEAETAAFLADYIPKLEKEANKNGPVHDAELLREVVIHQFGLVARECMAVCDSADHFEAEMRADIARFVHYGLNQYPWLADAMRQELDTGFTFFVMRANPWAQIPEAERASAWHVGAITGEALTHLALKLRAEALRNAVEGGFPKPDQAGATQPDAGPANDGTNPAESDGKGRKRGPKSDPDAASRVAEIVARVAPDGDWRPKLDDICEALDEAQIPFPQRWRKRDRSCDGWAAYDERANAVKAIEYRLEIAKQRKKVTPETLS